MLAGCEANGRTSIFSNLDPFCRPGTPYRAVATIDVEGEGLTDEIDFVEGGYSRSWISQLNSGGCQRKFGSIFAFVTRDRRLVLLGNHPRDGHAGYLIDDVDTPRTWRRFYLGSSISPVRLISMSVARGGTGSKDSLDRLAETFLASDFGSSGLRSGLDMMSKPDEPLHYRRQIRPARFHPVENPIVLPSDYFTSYDYAGADGRRIVDPATPSSQIELPDGRQVVLPSDRGGPAPPDPSSEAPTPASPPRSRRRPPAG